MIRTSLHQIADWLSLPRPDADVKVAGVSTDTRTLVPGNLFVALKGPNFDGHDYLSRARENGAVAAIVSQVDTAVDVLQLPVTDTLLALQQLATAWRDAVDPLVVAITGSAGKTTVKQLVAAMFRSAGPTLATQGNLNNEIGVPLTLLSLDAADRFAVIEMGANHMGEIASLVAIARPDHALVTMVGRAHLGEFGSVENIVHAKGEIYAGLQQGSQALINLDAQGADKWIRHCPVHWDGFAMDEATHRHSVHVHSADAHSFHAQHSTWVGVANAEDEMTILERGEILLRDQPLPLPGAHNRVNLLAAVALARQSGLAVEAIVAGLASFEPPKGRMQIETLAYDVTVIDDSYNANPESMRAAMTYLAGRPGCRVAVLGDMGELGEQAPELHRQLANVADELGLDAVITLGELAAAAASSPENACVDVDSAVWNVLDLLAQARKKQQPSTVLIKGSRFMRMERVLAGLRKHFGAKPESVEEIATGATAAESMTTRGGAA